MENTLFTLLSRHVPVIPTTFSEPPHGSRSSSRPRSRGPRNHAPSLRPLTLNSLRTTLFRRPAALRKLRCEAAERFLWWREIETAKERPDTLQVLLSGHERSNLPGFEEHRETWDWESRLSYDVATARKAMNPRPGISSVCLPYACLPLDPLHVSSLFLISLSLLRPLQDSIIAGLKFTLGNRFMAMTVVGAFCTGVSVGWLLGSA